MKKAAIILLFICLAQKAFVQQAVQSKLHFTSKERNRVCADSMYYYRFDAIDSFQNLISFKIESLPGWLHYDSADHSISGKPAKPGQYNVHLTALASDTTVHQRFMLTVYNNRTTNILTLGNSITNGTDKYNSYRRHLWQLLHKNNYNFDFIGSWSLHHMGGRVPDPDFDMDHDGHSGWKASDMLSPPEWDKKNGNIREWIRHYTPDIVLLELGTNEVFQCIPAKDAMTNISSIIEILRHKNPNVKIFIAQIPPLGSQWINKKLCGNKITYGQSIINFNKQVAKLASEKNIIGSRVIPVDQYSGINPATDMYDDIHPNETGEIKMAEKWYHAIEKYLKKLKD